MRPRASSAKTISTPSPSTAVTIAGVFLALRGPEAGTVDRVALVYAVAAVLYAVTTVSLIGLIEPVFREVPGEDHVGPIADDQVVVHANAARGQTVDLVEDGEPRHVAVRQQVPLVPVRVAEAQERGEQDQREGSRDDGPRDCREHARERQSDGHVREQELHEGHLHLHRVLLAVGGRVEVRGIVL